MPVPAKEWEFQDIPEKAPQALAAGIVTKSGLFRKEAKLLVVALSKQSKSIIPRHISRRANIMWAKKTDKNLHIQTLSKQGVCKAQCYHISRLLFYERKDICICCKHFKLVIHKIV